MTAPDGFLREKAREAIRRRTIPAEAPDRRFGATGVGEKCAVCGERIGREQMELELEFNRHGATPGIDHYHLHPRCYAAWETERVGSNTSAT